MAKKRKQTVKSITIDPSGQIDWHVITVSEPHAAIKM